MKKYEMPEIEIVRFLVEDVITASGDPGAGPEFGGPGDDD